MKRVLLDTNIIISALRIPNGVAAQAFWRAAHEEQVVLTQYIIDEARDVVTRKWPALLDVLNTLLDAISSDVLPESTCGVARRDAKDQPILDAAIGGSVDIIVTGDKDFHALTIDQPLILTPRQFLDL